MSIQAYEQMLREHLSPIDLTNCKHIDVGVHGHVIITTSGRVVHIPTVQKTEEQYKNAQKTLQYIQEHISTHVAQITKIVEATDTPGGFLFEMEHARGIELTHSNILSLSSQERSTLGEEIGGLLREVHHTPIHHTLPSRTISPPNLEKEFIALQENSFWNNVKSNDKEYILHVYRRAIPHFQTSLPIVMLHNDFGMNHVFVENNTLSAIIDWGDQTLGDPARDFRWAVGPRALDPTCFTSALSAYLKAETNHGFLERVLFYNEIKTIGRLGNMKSRDSGEYVRFIEAQKEIQYLKDYIASFEV